MSWYHNQQAMENRLAARRADPCVPLPCQAFWHIGCMNNWREVVQEQLDLFRSVHLNPIAGVLGTQEDVDWLQSLGINIGYHSDDLAQYETPTLQMLWNWCHKNPSGSVLYAHSKGVSAPNDRNKPAWRRLMAYYVIRRWRENLHRLATVDVIGVNWQHSPSHPHFSGNFWMARADWIRSLPTPWDHLAAGGPSIAGHPWRRMHCEMWLGSRGWHHVGHLCCENRNLWSGDDVFHFLAEAQQKEKMRILEAILAAGSDDVHMFGGRYDGGLHIQQVPEELADAVMDLQGRPYQKYLEIGAAAGGTARILRDLLEIPNVYVVDDNKHPKHGLRATILPDAVEWIGNSHDPACARQLAEWGCQFDLVLIDADHAYAAVRADLDLVQKFLAPDAVVMLHDVACSPGPKRLWQEIADGQHCGYSAIGAHGQRCGIGLVQWNRTAP